MTEVTAREIKDAFGSIGAWPGWARGQVWRVPVRRPLRPIDFRLQEPEAVAKPNPIPVIEFKAEPAIENETGRKVWLFYGRHGDLKVLCEVTKRSF